MLGYSLDRCQENVCWTYMFGDSPSVHEHMWFPSMSMKLTTAVFYFYFFEAKLGTNVPTYLPSQRVMQ